MQVFLTPEYLAICMEYAKGGDMFQYVKAKGGLQARTPLARSRSRNVLSKVKRQRWDCCTNCWKRYTCLCLPQVSTPA